MTNKTTMLMLTLCSLFLGIADLQAQPESRIRPNKTVLLYPEGQNSGKGLPETKGPGESNEITGCEKTNSQGFITMVSDSARIDLYFPKKPNGQMIVVCPGGGYHFLSSHNEGIYVAEWMLEKGISIAVVKYRLPNGHWEVPLTDVQNAFRYCRAHADEWNIRQIGIMGFSAGGHLAASATTMYEDAVTRPDFSVLVYPVITMERGITHNGTRDNLIGKDEKWNSREGKNIKEWEASKEMHGNLLKRYSLQNNITPDTPPVFLVHCSDDKTVPVENSLLFYRNLIKNKVNTEMHIFPKGGHGWGFSSLKYVDSDNFNYCRKEFENSLTRWLEGIRNH